MSNGKVQAFIFKPKRRRNGKLIKSAFFSMRYKLPGERRYATIPLGVRDEQVAESKRLEFVRERERELAGIIAPKAMRDAAERRLADHLADFVSEKLRVGRDRMYVYNIERHVTKLIAECSWQRLRDVTADSFEVWRRGQELEPKTLNQYLADASALLNWLRRRGHLIANPLTMVEKLSEVTDGGKVRALSDDEVQRLLAVVSGERKAVYLLALVTGLRRAELEALQWGDVHLDALKPFLKARPSTTKNAKLATIFLRDDVVAELRAIRPATAAASATVFANGVPEVGEIIDGVAPGGSFRADLAAAGIPFEDDQGRKVVVHSLRHTLATNLAKAGVAPRIAMEVMRHSDMRLTAKVYTDATLLPTSDAYEKLPRWDTQENAQTDAQMIVNGSPAMSADVHQCGSGKLKITRENRGESASSSVDVHTCPAGGENWGTRIRS